MIISICFAPILDEEGKGLLDLLLQLRTLSAFWLPIKSHEKSFLYMCVLIHQCVYTHTHVLFMGTVYEAIVNLNMLFIYSKKGCFLYCLPLQDSDLKQYWMPDSQCKECYDCSEKFTTFRRRHHCRLCGQIFCSRCCNQEIPGKFMGYTGGA